MREKSDSNKNFMQGLSGSLTFRILLTTTILIVIPLLVFSGLIYYEDSRLKTKDNIFTFNLILRGKLALIQEVIHAESRFLSYVEKIQPAQDKLQTLSSQDNSSILLHLVKTGGQYLCNATSRPDFIGIDLSKVIPKQIPSTGILVSDPDRDLFYFLKPFSNGKEIWASGFSEKRLMNKLGVGKNTHYPTIIALLSNNNKILLSTNSTWQNKDLPLTFTENGLFSFMDDSYVGYLDKIKQSNLSLLVATPKHVNFVDIPYFFAKMSLLLLIILIIGGGLTLWLTFRLGKPLKNLCAVMKQIESTNLSARYQPDPMGFEINIVGSIFNKMIESLLNFIDQIKHERAAKETFKQELKIGKQVQTSLLPKNLPSFPGLDIAARFLSAKEVGGDFYDFLIRPKKEDDHLFFSIADTAGKGVYACLYSLTVRSMLRSYSQTYDQLDLIAQETNNLFCTDTGDTGAFVTTWLGIFEERSKKLRFTNCGHLPTYLMRKNGQFEKLTTPGMALGVEPFDHVHTNTVQLNSGDRLLLFTDGVIEAHNNKLEMFGEKKLIHSFMEKKDLEVQEVVDAIIEEVSLFAEEASQHDDLTLLTLKVN